MARWLRSLQQCCPPLVWSGLSRLSRRLRAGPRLVRTLAELDREIAHADAVASAENDDAFRRALNGFRFDPPIRLPANPTSPEYAQAQKELYELVSGRATYEAELNEKVPIDIERQANEPFPYPTRSSITVGEQLMAIGFLIRALELRPGDRILEFGPGWGNTTLQFRQMGYPVTAVDVNRDFLQMIQFRLQKLGLDVDAVHADMLEYRSTTPFERVVFFECFHHCADHVQMIRNLDNLVAPGGAVVFAGEPITDDFPVPWGLRLDGMSLWSTRKFGWLELGFCKDYFRKLLKDHGWSMEVHESRDVGWMQAIVAKRKAA